MIAPSLPIGQSSWLGQLVRRTRAALPARAPSKHRAKTLETRKDQQLARRICTTVERDLAAADLRELHFYVYRGTVTVFGTVRHDLDRDLLTALAGQIPGVENVINCVKIRPVPRFV